MAIKFGLDLNNETPEVSTNTANSTSSGTGTSKTKTDSEKVSDLMPSYQKTSDFIIAGAKNAPKSESSPTTPPPVVVDNTIDTDQLESSPTSSSAVLPEPVEVPRYTPPESVTPTPVEDSEQQKELKVREEENKRLRDEVFESLSSLSDIGDFTAQLEEDNDVKRKREAKTAIDNRIMKKNREYDLALRDAEDTFGTRAQKNAIKNEIKKDYNRRLADLSIQQMALAGEYNDAVAEVNRKVELELADRRSELDALSFLYTENKDRLTLVEQREFNKKLVTEERVYQSEFAKTQQLEQMKLTMLINATEAGAGPGTLDAIQGATSTASLLSLPGASVYTKSKADRLAEQLASINVSKASRELDLLNNPPQTSQGMTPTLLKTINGLGAGERTALTDANDTVRSLERLRELIETEDFATLATDATELGREFNRLSKDVADKMARERTGAVVTSNEEKTFKKIMGLTLFNRSISDSDEIVKTLNQQIQKHNESQNLVDPTGEIRSFLDASAGVDTTSNISVDDFLDSQVIPALQQNVYGTYVTNN